jgi:hypothetical protein
MTSAFVWFHNSGWEPIGHGGTNSQNERDGGRLGGGDRAWDWRLARCRYAVAATETVSGTRARLQGHPGVVPQQGRGVSRGGRPRVGGGGERPQ